MIMRSLKSFFAPPAMQQEAHEAYSSLVAQARKQVFYERLGIADTMDGRFDVILMHMFLLIHRLRRETDPEAPLFIRALSEAFFADMDRSLREMGVGDTGVGKRVRRMVEAFYGRLAAYEQGLLNPSALEESIRRNLYRGDEGAKHVAAIREYMMRNLDRLSAQETAAIMLGQVSFSD